MKTIFISYNHGDKDIAEKFDFFSLDKKIKIIKDDREMHYRESIKCFMEKIRETDFCLMIISDTYLKSRNCMYEVLEFIKDNNYKERILPIVLKGVKIFDIMDRLAYIKYWEERYNVIEDSLKTINILNQEDGIQELKMIANIQHNIGEFLRYMADEVKLIVNVTDLTEDEYNEIYKIIDPKYSAKSNETVFADKGIKIDPESVIKQLINKGFEIDPVNWKNVFHFKLESLQNHFTEFGYLKIYLGHSIYVLKICRNINECYMEKNNSILRRLIYMNIIDEKKLIHI